ncbi:exodeoxyribonuclease VII small subunit [Pasteurella atlantica]|uniref:Exodeoxyribonuclease 7 small subunit n=4 Tax=Pasteurellaceae TaxID=712 RepID=A0A1H7Z943_9PAST|nr:MULTISPECIES: exodeoxyribonuclease VII small subunit [Pasteurella]MBR0574241.1 exodeoxyribonuclease VII small subunit [Pasteurella atlantica]MDP8033974.1 exodeoxyribonuclease VII small subunit [Pasteurella atlantica]MDP8035847.1 exodeoxyribonuclease VII small subunit [Pasteurella atlantica]MDP8037858.1 exodeoxyribonuclease VII small subunit [Pasteurella atlantica]MDP8038529.1 exodeoxyribonuclease VII small subunit [Pasteurella atlantica]
MAKKPQQDFETTLKQLEDIVTHLEAGDLPLEEALSEFETAVKLVKKGQEHLQKAEQRIQILLQKDEHSELSDYQ